MRAPEQPVLPTWLESLRPGERAAASPSEQPSFFTADLIDKDALPGWMRPESADRSPSDQYPRIRPASLATSNTDRGLSMITASSLIDEQSLPSWFHEPLPGQQDPSASPYSAQKNLSAGSLVQPSALPEWMKNAEPHTVTPPLPYTANAEPHTVTPPLPYASTDIPLQGMVASSLIDPQVLPAWMSVHDEPRESTPTTGQSGLAVGSLLDVNALPSWLLESEQKHVKAEANLPAPSWQTSPMHEKQTIPPFIDVNTPPEWRRAAKDQGQGAEPTAYGYNNLLRQGAEPTAIPPAQGYNNPPRQGAEPTAVPPTHSSNNLPHVGAVRVPTRPRGERGSRGEIEAAANIFVSMFDGTSPSPYFVSRSSSSITDSPLPQEQSQSQHFRPQVDSVTPPARGNVGQGNTVISGPQPRVTGPASAYPPGLGGYQQGYPMGPQQPPAIQQQQPTDPSALPMDGQVMPDVNPSELKPSKRGILETFRDWFSR